RRSPLRRLYAHESAPVVQTRAQYAKLSELLSTTQVNELSSSQSMSWRCWLSVLPLLLASSVSCASCTSSDTTQGEAPHGIEHPRQDHGYSMDDVLRMNHVQFKATHNSYHIETNGNKEPTWHYTHAPLNVQLDVQGVRGLELDTRYVASSDRFEV